MRHTGIRSHEIAEYWLHLEPFFMECARLSDGEYTAEELRRECETGQRQCWAAADDEVRAVTLTTLGPDPYKVVEIQFCVGERMDEWRDAKLAFILEWARAQGSKRWRVFGRAGWGRVLEKWGLRERARVFQGEL